MQRVSRRIAGRRRAAVLGLLHRPPEPRKWLEASVRFAQRNRAAWPAAGIVAVTVAAYHFTLVSLFDFLRFDTSLAYLALLPPLALFIAIVTAHRFSRAKATIRDRHVDLIVGVALLVASLVLITLVPVIASTYYWSDRADVLSLALFAAGATVLCYGVNWLWRLRTSFVLLFLAWPALYLRVLGGLLQGFISSTNAVLASVAGRLPLSVSFGAHSGLVVLQHNHNAPVNIDVGTVSPAANCMLGIALIGAAILTLVDGSRGRKLLWWANGVALAFLLNLVRLVVILVLAAIGHTNLATGGFRVLISSVVFVLTLAVMVRALPRFGLHRKEPVVASTTARPSPAASPGDQEAAGRVPVLSTLGSSTTRRRRAQRRRRVVAGAVLIVTVFLALINHGLQSYAAFGDVAGAPTVKAFSARSVPSGWHLVKTKNYRVASLYFGARTSWVRYLLVPPHGPSSVYADVVLTSDRSALALHNVLSSFLFRNYSVRSWEGVDLGDAVYGLVVNYVDQVTGASWGAVSWVWPVAHGADTYFERIVLSANLNRGRLVRGFSLASGPQDIFLGLMNSTGGSMSNPGVMHAYHDVDVLVESTAESLVHRALQTRS